MSSAAIMFQGTGSDVGKSLIVAGLCRLAYRRGLNVRPFKPQNMSNNAAVTADGGEIGRAQALQARACGVAPSIHMNPVLLKPQSEIGAQVVVQGQVTSNVRARDYAALKPTLLPAVMDSYAQLTSQADLVVVEGAGSPAEVNLRDGDIANMGFAEAADLPVVLIADIDRGGALAAIVGTHSLLQPVERKRLAGYLINKFRGDAALFEPAKAIIGTATGMPCHGVLPWFDDAGRLPAEDAMNVPISSRTSKSIRIAVPHLGRLANFDDLDPLRGERNVEVDFIRPGNIIGPDFDLIVLPGSKSTRSDLESLRRHGWDIDIKAHVRRGGLVVGICGGYQMLGNSVADPGGLEGPPGETAGLGLLDVETQLTPAKRLGNVTGNDTRTGEPITGYEMHMGRTTGHGLQHPMVRLGGKNDGAVSADGRVMGCYLHGIFASDSFRRAFLDRIATGAASTFAYETMVESTLDGLAEHLDRHTDTDALFRIAGL